MTRNPWVMADEALQLLRQIDASLKEIRSILEVNMNESDLSTEVARRGFDMAHPPDCLCDAHSTEELMRQVAKVKTDGNTSP